MATTATAPPVASTRNQERVAELTQTIEESLTHLEAELALGHTRGFLQVLEFYSRFHRYSFNNTLLIHAQRPDATLVAGYRKWQELGFQVKRGETGIAIRAPWLKKLPDPDTGEILPRLVGYVATTVFDISQTHEWPEKQPPSWRHDLGGSRDWAYEYCLLKITIGTTGVLIGEEPLPHGVHGMAWQDRIAINPRLSDSEKFLVALHEWAHQLAHFGDERQDTTKKQREVEAEACAFVVSRLCGIEHPFSRDYLIRHGCDPEYLRQSLERIQTISRHMARLMGLEEAR